MQTLRLCAVTALALLTFTAASGPAGSDGIAGCGTMLTVKDPVLRAQFASIDRAQPTDLVRLCTVYRQAAVSQTR
jgi:hypothetical protein